MEPFLSLLFIVAVVVVLIWLVKQIPWPKGLEVLGFIATVIIVLGGIAKIWPLLGV